MQILIIPSWYPNTYNMQYGIFIKEQAEALAKNGFDVGVIHVKEISIVDILKQKKLDISNTFFIEGGVKTYRLQYPVPPKLYAVRRKVKLHFFKKIFKQYVKENGFPNIVHLHNFNDGELAIWIKEKYGISYVVTEHFTGFARDAVTAKNLYRAKKVYKESAYNIAVSNEFVQLLEEKVNNKFNYIANIVNVNFFDIKTDAKREGFEFINIAYLDKKKNQAMLLKAFYNAFKNNPQIRLTIVGDGPEYNNLNRLIKELNLEEQVFLYGRASREEVKRLLQSSDAFVLSSQYETFGVVVIEALACGLPVVATKCGGPESIITNERIGLLSDIDEHSLSKNMIQMMENRASYNANYIRDYVKDNFSEEAVVLKLKDVYEKVLK